MTKKMIELDNKKSNVPKPSQRPKVPARESFTDHRGKTDGGGTNSGGPRGPKEEK